MSALGSAVDRRTDELTTLLAQLVQARTELGHEEAGQLIVEQRLHQLGFGVERIRPDADDARADPRGGYPALSYEGRTCVAGRLMGTGGGRSLHLSGHVDVVPVEAEERWTHDPWGGVVRDGRLWGRGSGDMKAGLAAYLVAAEVALEVCGPPDGDLLFSSVIEEECGGNGMRAVLGAGYDADATLIGEPSGLTVLHGGVGVIWFRLRTGSAGAHALEHSAEPSPIEQLLGATQALRGLETQLNGPVADPFFATRLSHPYNLNLGELRAGAWPSSAPAEAVLRGRLGFGRDLEPVQAQELVIDALATAAPGVEVSFEGFRAHAYAHGLDDPFVDALDASHAELHGVAPGRTVVAATTDARWVSGPCLCYGPTAGGTHAIDEWVDLASVRETALVVAGLIARWCYGPTRG